MNIKITGSHILALLIVVGIAFWMQEGEVVVGGQAPAAEDERPAIADREEAGGGELFKVSFVEIATTEREQSITVRGRTKADAIVPIRAETAGILEKRHVNRGDKVSSGDLVCTIESGAREAAVASAKASLERAQAEYAANEQLAKKGFASDIKLREMRANMDAARSGLRQAEVELGRIEIRANASGTVQDPIAQAGDVLNPGSTCVTLIDSNPMFFTGQVAEREIGLIEPGMNAVVKMVTGEEARGAISYVAPSADPQTRTFLTEIELDASTGALRDGLTATARILLPSSQSFRISPSWVSLEDNGEVGVKIIDADNKVAFRPVTILSQAKNGFWVSGPENGDRIITRGQEFVATGEIVEPVPDPIVNAELSQ